MGSETEVDELNAEPIRQQLSKALELLGSPGEGKELDATLLANNTLAREQRARVAIQALRGAEMIAKAVGLLAFARDDLLGRVRQARRRIDALERLPDELKNLGESIATLADAQREIAANATSAVNMGRANDADIDGIFHKISALETSLSELRGPESIRSQLGAQGVSIARLQRKTQLRSLVFGGFIAFEALLHGALLLAWVWSLL